MKKFDLNKIFEVIKENDFFEKINVQSRDFELHEDDSKSRKALKSSKAKEFLLQNLFESTLFISANFNFYLQNAQKSMGYKNMSLLVKEYIDRTNNTINALWMNYMDHSKEQFIMKIKQYEYSLLFDATRSIFSIVSPLSDDKEKYAKLKSNKEESQRQSMKKSKADNQSEIIRKSTSKKDDFSNRSKNKTYINKEDPAVFEKKIYEEIQECDDVASKLEEVFKEKGYKLNENLDKKIFFNFSAASVELAKVKKLFLGLLLKVKEEYKDNLP